MTGKILWKVIVSALVFLWAGMNLVPLKDQPFGKFLTDKHKAQDAGASEEVRLGGLVAQARENVEEELDLSEYLALRRMGRDGFTYYKDGLPVLKLENEADLISRQNIERRDDGKWYEIGDKEPLDEVKVKGIDFVEFFPKAKAGFAGIKNRDKRNDALLK